MTDSKLAEVEQAFAKVWKLNTRWTAKELTVFRNLLFPVISRLLDAEAQREFDAGIRVTTYEMTTSGTRQDHPALDEFRSALKGKLDAAHADALRAAAELLPHDEVIPVKLEPGIITQGVFTTRAAGHQPDCHKCAILVLTPERTRLERELEVEKLLLEESHWWINAQGLEIGDLIGVEKERFVMRRERVADLEAKLAALDTTAQPSPKRD